MSPGPRSRLREKRIVVLPDFFLDAIVRLPAWGQMRTRWERTIRHGGGNLPVGPIEFKVGGNAANLAFALARLGARVELVTRTSPLGKHLLGAAARGTRLGLSHAKTGPTSSATLALEFGGSNVMLSHAGPLFDFGPHRLDAAAWRSLEAADAVAVTNWAQNRSGTRLLEALARRLGRRGVFLYLDTGDPRHRGGDAQALLRKSAIWTRISAWGLNENEVRAFSQDAPGDVRDLADRLSQRLGCRLDLHTRHWALSVAHGARTAVPAYRGPPRRLTGAGDAWNAGNLTGYLLGRTDRQRLRLAHRVASRYVTGRDGQPPTAAQLGLK